MIQEYPFCESQRVSGGSHKEILKYLIKRFGVCYHCGVTVVYRERVKGYKQRGNDATIDHLISRYSRKKGQKVPKVLACYECNQKRGNEGHNSCRQSVHDHIDSLTKGV